MKYKNYFLDESGDADFFGKRGKELWEQPDWNPFLLIGMLEVVDRKKLRGEIVDFQNELKKDRLFKGIVSFEKNDHFFHAKDDHPEIRAEFFRFLRGRNDFKCYFSLVEKEAKTFIDEFERNSKRFYFHVVENLLKLADYDTEEEHAFYLSRRTKHTHADFDKVIKSAIDFKMKGENMKYSADIVKSSEYPELSVIDYMLWAVQRCRIRSESRFLDALSDKVDGIVFAKGSLANCDEAKLAVDAFIDCCK